MPHINRKDLNRQLALIDPVDWITNYLAEHPWSIQQRIFESVRDNKRTAVHSCHNCGKSWTASRIACWWLFSHDPGDAFVVTTAPTFPQVRAILWREIGRAHANWQLIESRTNHGNIPGRLNQTEWFMTNEDLGNEEMVAFGRKPSDISPTDFQGIHAPNVLVIIDEACGVHVNIWEAADTLVSNSGSKIFAVGNPDDPLSEFATVCKPGSGWNVIGIDGFDTPNFTGEPIPEKIANQLISPAWAEEKRRKWGETNPLYISKVRGKFPSHSTDNLIPMHWIRAAQERSLPISGDTELGVDVGRGGDKSIIAHRTGGRVRIIHRDTNPDTMQTAGNVVHHYKESGASLIKIDLIGIGAGVHDRVKELDHPIIGVNVGSSPHDKERYLNLRAEGYWGLRERFETGTIDIDPLDDDLAAQLADIKYKRTSSGKIQIESKEEMARRGKHSPDDADAVMLAFIDPVTEQVCTSATWGD